MHKFWRAETRALFSLFKFILAGMFGLRTNAKNESFIKGTLKQSFEAILRLSHWREVDWMDRKNIDQTALKKVIWPLAKNASAVILQILYYVTSSFFI